MDFNSSGFKSTTKMGSSKFHSPEASRHNIQDFQSLDDEGTLNSSLHLHIEKTEEKRLEIKRMGQHYKAK